MDLHKIKPADLSKIKHAEYTLALRNFLKNKQNDISDKPADFVLIHDFKFKDKEAALPLLLIGAPDSTFRGLKLKKDEYAPITFGGCMLTTEESVDDELEEGEEVPEDIGSWKSVRFAPNLGTKDPVAIKASLKKVKAAFRFNKLHYTIADIKVGQSAPALSKKAGFKLIGTSGYAKMEILQNRYTSLKDAPKQLEALAELKRLASEWITSHGKSKKSDDIEKKKEMDELLIWIGNEEVRVKSANTKKTGGAEKSAKVMNTEDNKKFTELDTNLKRLKVEMATKGLKKTDDEIIKALLKKQDPKKKDADLDHAVFEFNMERNLINGEYDTQEKMTAAALDMLSVHLETWKTNKIGVIGETALAFSLRNNTFTSRIVTLVGNELAGDYTKNVAEDLLKDIPAVDDLEIDPVKVKEGVDAEANMTMLKGIYDKLMDSIIKKAETSMSAAFRKYIKGIYDMALAKRLDMDGEEAKREALEVVGGVFVLRILNPSITNISAKAKPNQKRAIILLSKVFQNQANFVDFGSKEPFMMPFNASLAKNKVKLAQLLEEMVS